MSNNKKIKNPNFGFFYFTYLVVSKFLIDWRRILGKLRFEVSLTVVYFNLCHFGVPEEISLISTLVSFSIFLALQGGVRMIWN